MVNQTEIKRLSDYIGPLNIVAFTPDSMELIKGAPVGRRYFLDVFLGQSDKAYFLALAAVQARAQATQRVVKAIRPLPPNRRNLHGRLRRPVRPHGRRNRRQTRRSFSTDVAGRANQIFAFLSGRADSLELTYQPSVERDFKATLQSKLKSDLHQGTDALRTAPRRLHVRLGRQTGQRLRLARRTTARHTIAQPRHGRLHDRPHRRDSRIAARRRLQRTRQRQAKPPRPFFTRLRRASHHHDHFAFGHRGIELVPNETLTSSPKARSGRTSRMDQNQQQVRRQQHLKSSKGWRPSKNVPGCTSAPPDRAACIISFGNRR
ncbi:MAG: hypothetical protein MZU97_15130 [Bacillus subtilis]|nr:hypothetical protein [Bacillus subtilis]